MVKNYAMKSNILEYRKLWGNYNFKANELKLKPNEGCPIANKRKIFHLSFNVVLTMNCPYKSDVTILCPLLYKTFQFAC